MNSAQKFRLPLLLLGILALLSGIWSGLNRLGWGLPSPAAPFPSLHGPLMIGGFLGTLISLERAVALKRPWGYGAPLACAVAGLGMLFFPQALVVWQAALLLGSLLLVSIFGSFLKNFPGMAIFTMAAGSTLWVVGNLLWLAGGELSQAVFWWLGFLIITIAGERLELTRYVNLPPAARKLFAGIAIVIVLGLLIAFVDKKVGWYGIGLGYALLALWLLNFDIARRTIRKAGLTRFSALCLLSGYVWLFFSGALMFGYGHVTIGPFYDSVLHSVLIGFVFSMIFAHAPVIFPSILGLPIGYQPLFYGPLALLHASLVLRMIGDIFLIPTLRMWGGLLNAVAIVVFLLTVRLSFLKQAKKANP